MWNWWKETDHQKLKVLISAVVVLGVGMIIDYKFTPGALTLYGQILRGKENVMGIFVDILQYINTSTYGHLLIFTGLGVIIAVASLSLVERVKRIIRSLGTVPSKTAD